ncbi:plasma kallikrein-like [Manduca sexta]|uniref:Peptidase S1 domain-containing protein n=1 Tax=Manduca sexta TaxID=7130 RepID=A0A922CHR0_MANSE|nr:plasma kallikrein-like [Manduca sexta]KAG6446058.1 hypothetical protein O3G_MSEX004253 [Manduca sexta]
MYGRIIFISLVFGTIQSKKHLRIIGGRDAEENEYPYVARVEILRITDDKVRRIHICTSGVITPVWTVTAAHCFQDIIELIQMRRNTKSRQIVRTRDIKPVIWFGNVAGEPSKDTYRDIVDTVLHPSAKCSRSSILVFVCQNDIGLFRTDPISINQYAKLSALDAVSLKGQEVELVGYGITNVNGEVDDTLAFKKPLQVLKAMVKSCADDVFMSPALCLARACGQSSTMCPGDSGGPVLHPSGVVAINSMAFISDCFVSSEKDRSHVVGQLTPISSYIDWICDVTNDNKTSRA